MALFIIADQRYPSKKPELFSTVLDRDTEKLSKMTRGRGGFDDAVVPYRRKPVQIDEVDNLYLGSRKACRVSDFANDDTEDISRRSYNKDKKLLDDITNKLCRLEFDNVKVGRDVAKKTGFRRHLYGNARPPVEKETLEERRLERLRNPWDYTTNNYFRPAKREPRTKQEKEEAAKRKKERPLWLRSEIMEPEKPKDAYPEHDPLGLYRPREKKKRPELPPAHTPSKYDNMNLREKLANCRAKVESLPRRRDIRHDLDTMLEDVVNKPLPRSHVSEYKTLDGDEYDPDWQYTPDPGLDERMKRKVTDSRSELEQFDRMLDRKFGGKRGMRGPSAADKEYNPYGDPVLLRAPSRVPAKVNMAYGIAQLERELGIHDDGYGYEMAMPTPVHRMREPVVVKARTNTRGGSYRPRSGSMPHAHAANDRVGRAKLQSDIECYLSNVQLTDGPAPCSYASLRSKALDAKTKLDMHKTMMDRYLPLYMGPENEVPYEVDYMYGELVNRMPALDPYRPNQAHVEGGSGHGPPAIVPYQAARMNHSPRPAGLPPKAPAFRPQMSDTRRRIREVMCSTKRDPHYYD